MASTTATTEYPVLDVLGPAPPIYKSAYRPSNALDDLPGVRYALSLFLASYMLECEDWCNVNDGSKERLYFTSGHGLIQTVKALMSYEDEDLLSAIGHTKHAIGVAQQHRKRPTSVLSKVASYVTSTSSLSYVKSMTAVERHAELVFAETTFEKALLGVVYSGDWFTFAKEALAMRSAISVYRSLYKYLTALDAAHPSGKDPSIDEDFRSGVLLGTGMTSLTLSLLPSRVLGIVELFGYKGDRTLALETLAQAGGWRKEDKDSEPRIGILEEGVRRPLCDMCLLVFHLVMSSLTFEGIDLHFASRILSWNLRRYPSGVFLLFGSGRLALQSSMPAASIVHYTAALKCQNQYRNLHYISYWEMAMATLSLWDLDRCLQNWRPLQQEATWSRATYTYGAAATLLEMGSKEHIKEAKELLGTVGSLIQKIAGKSIPIEKFATRKSRKYMSQGFLVLPLLELGYFFQCIAHTSLETLLKRFIPLVEQNLEHVESRQAIGIEEKDKERENGRRDSKEKEKGSGYWDDYCLVRFLQGVCYRYVAFPDPDAAPESRALTDDTKVPPIEEAIAKAEEAFAAVLAHGTKIELDHHLVYHTHFELGRLLANKGEEKEARHHLELVLSGKPLETSARKGKYSLENTLIMRTTAAMDALETGRKV